MITISIYAGFSAIVLTCTFKSWRELRKNRPPLWPAVQAYLDWAIVTAVGCLSLNPLSEVHMGYAVALASGLLIQKKLSFGILGLCVVVGSCLQPRVSIYWAERDPQIAATLVDRYFGVRSTEGGVFLYREQGAEDIVIHKPDVRDHWMYRQVLGRLGGWSIAACSMFIIFSYKLLAERNWALLRQTIDCLPFPVFVKLFRKSDNSFPFEVANVALQKAFYKPLLQHFPHLSEPSIAFPGNHRDSVEKAMQDKTDSELRMKHSDAYYESDKRAMSQDDILEIFEPHYHPEAPNGKIKTFKRRIVDKKGNPIGIVGVCFDADADLQLRWMQDFLGALPVCVFAKSMDGKFTYVNQAFANDCGKSVEEIIKLKDRDLYPDDLAELYEAEDRKLSRNQVTISGEQLHRCKDEAESRTVTYSKALLFSPDHEPQFIIGAFFEALSDAKIKRAFQVWARHMNPVVELLRQRGNSAFKDPGVLAFYSQCIALYPGRASREVLSGLNPENCNIAAVLANQVEVAKKVLEPPSGNISFSCDLDGLKSHDLVKVDLTRIGPALWAMLFNAHCALHEKCAEIGSCEEAGPLIEVRFRYVAESRRMQLLVLDRGCGFGPDKHDEILNGSICRFSRGHQDGLWLLKALAAAFHGGEFDLRSEGERMGATAEFSWNYWDADAPHDSDQTVRGFIVHSHHDVSPYLADLCSHLQELDPAIPVPGSRGTGGITKRQRVRRVEGHCWHFWYDRRLKAGDPWDQKINDMIQDSRYIILLLTASFWRSDYIREVELPLIEGLRKNYGGDGRKFRVVPLYAERCEIPKDHWIAKLQPIGGSMDEWLCEMDDNGRKEFWRNVITSMREFREQCCIDSEDRT